MTGTATPVPSGGSPDGTGGSPVLPALNRYAAGFGTRAVCAPWSDFASHMARLGRIFGGQPNSDEEMRPYVICHMCTSIDGKILGDRWGKLPGYKHQSDLFETTAASFGIGAWLVGTTTMDEFDGRKVKLPRAGRTVPRRDHIANKGAKRLAIGADAKGVLRFQENEVDGDHVVLLITNRVGNDYLAHLQSAGVSYLFCGRKEIDLHTALRKLGSVFKLRKLMLQGGGKFNGAMLEAGLIDEISHITVPVADGGVGISGFFDIPGRPPGRAAASLRLLSQQQLPGGVIWCRYKVVARRIR